VRALAVAALHPKLLDRASFTRVDAYTGGE
jgi:hypothetical protein